MPEKNAPHADYHPLQRDKLSPMMQHYIAVKEQYPHALLLYRVGDFFECFFQDAVTISQELELVLTSKEGGKDIGRVRMTGVPHHALDRYSAQLVEKGYAVAICDQVEEAAKAKAEGRIVERQVTRLLTPGTLTDDGMLTSRRNNFLAAVVIAKQHWGLAYADISTGEFFATQAQNTEVLQQELLRLQPAEILLPTNAPDLGSLLRPGQKSADLPDGLPDCFCYSLRPQRHFDLGEARSRLLGSFELRSLEGIGCEHLPLSIRAAGGLLEYLETTQKAHRVPLQPPRTYSLSDYLILDHQSRRNLEITQTVRDGSFHGSLLWALDRTQTAMGGRALRRWLLQPLLEREAIRTRQATIRELADDLELRQELSKTLRQFYDLERLSGRVGAGTANARDLCGLADSLVRLTALAAIAQRGQSPYLRALQQPPADLERLGQHVLSHLVESPPLHLKDGGVIRDGIHAQLDERRQQLAADRQWLADLEVTERDRLGSSKLKVGYNKVFGYYLSLPRGEASKAPPDYTRKQTLVNEERYITSELKERETRILTAREEMNQLEYEIFADLRSQVSEQVRAIRTAARAVAAVDVLAGLAEVAASQNYCCPALTDDRVIHIEAGRHPVVEQSLPAGSLFPTIRN